MKEFRFLGIISLVDPPRPAAPSAVAKCRSAGIKVIMITGDHTITAITGIISPGNKTVEDIAGEKGIPLDQVDTRNVKAEVVLSSEHVTLTESEMDETIRSNSHC